MTQQMVQNAHDTPRNERIEAVIETDLMNFPYDCVWLYKYSTVTVSVQLLQLHDGIHCSKSL